MARWGEQFKGRQFTAEVILWAVRWYLQFPVSYRDLEVMLQDHGISVDLAAGDVCRIGGMIASCFLVRVERRP